MCKLTPLIARLISNYQLTNWSRESERDRELNLTKLKKISLQIS